MHEERHVQGHEMASYERKECGKTIHRRCRWCSIMDYTDNWSSKYFTLCEMPFCVGNNGNERDYFNHHNKAASHEVMNRHKRHRR